MYPLLILTLFLVIQMLFMLQTRKNVLDKAKTELADSINSSNKIYTLEEVSILLSSQEAEINKLKNDLVGIKNDQSKTLGKAYPIGSIYISYTNTNPSSLFGGTWVAFGTGKTLVGVDTSQAEFNTIGKTGGEKTHTLTINEMPSHYHSSPPDAIGFATYHQGETIANSNWTFGGNNYLFGGYNKTTSTGGNQAHNNLQPYITVYMWRRTA